MQMPHPFRFFSEWLSEPLSLPTSITAQALLSVVAQHPLHADETAQDFFVAPSVEDGRATIYTENQGNWTYFLRAGDEQQPDPPVYFDAGSFDLQQDFGLPAERILADQTVLAHNHLTGFLWHALARYLCLRLEKSEALAPSVAGLTFASDIELDSDWSFPEQSPFLAGYSAKISQRGIYIPEWGAVFLSELDRTAFVERYQPDVNEFWE